MTVKIINKSVLILFAVVLIMAAGAIAEDDTVTDIYKSGTDINYIVLCSLNNSVCPVATTCNWTLFDPNNILIVDLQNLTRTSSYYNFTLSSNITNKTGYYTGEIFCSNGVYNKQESIKFLITSNGKLDSENDFTLYLLAALLILAGGLTWFAHYTSEAIFAFFSAILFSISGLYVALYGLGTGNNFIEYAGVVILVGLGLFMVIASSLAFLQSAEAGAEDTIFTRWIRKGKGAEEE